MKECTFPIESENRLARLLGRSKDEIRDVALEVGKYYRKRILRQPNKDRPILIPVGKLADIQRRILLRLFTDFSPQSCSFGGIKGRSPYMNATVHANRPFLAKLDIRDFYPNVHFRWVQAFFERRHCCSPPVANVLRRLLTFNGGLPQGTCTSPALADQILAPIDNRLLRAFEKHDITYTRFVDDMTISADFSLRRITKLVTNVLREYGLHVNHDKRFYYGPDDVPVVTGYTCRGGAGIPRSYMRKIASELRQAKLYADGLTDEPPPFNKESYWGVISYIRKTNPKAAAELKTRFDAIDWTCCEGLNLPARKAKLEKPLRNAE